MKRVKVWDPAVRLSHLAMGVLVLAAFLTSEEDDTLPLHMRLGLGLLGVVLFRFVWGFVGSTHARSSDFVKGPKAVLAAVGGMVRGKPEHTLGHNVEPNAPSALQLSAGFSFPAAPRLVTNSRRLARHQGVHGSFSPPMQPRTLFTERTHPGPFGVDLRSNRHGRRLASRWTRAAPAPRRRR